MYKTELNPVEGFAVRIVADSHSPDKKNRIVTFELEYPRFIHGEVMTHRVFSRNAMSSRAVPISKVIEMVENSPATPVHWGANQSGMQANNQIAPSLIPTAVWAWKEAMKSAVNHAKEMEKLGLHKQIVNRLIEPFQTMKTVITTTEVENFFNLRMDTDAQPEFLLLAKTMNQALEQSSPQVLKAGEWHTPYVSNCKDEEGNLKYKIEQEDTVTVLTLEEALAISASCCAQVSYRGIDNSYDKALRVYSRLGVGTSKFHASPFEHQATPIKSIELEWDTEEVHLHEINTEWPDSWEKGITHRDKQGELWSANFKGFIQHRQIL